MSFNAKQKKLIAGHIVSILELMSPEEAEELEEEELEEEEVDDKPAKRASKRKSSNKKSGKKKAPTLNEIRKAMRQFSKDYDKEAAKELLEPYDAKSLSAVDEDDYASLLSDIESYEE